MSKTSNIEIHELKREEILDFSRIICEGFVKKIPVFFKGMNKDEIAPFFAKIIESAYKKVPFSGNYVATDTNGRKVLGVLRVTFKDMIKEPWGPAWKILKERLGFFKALRTGFWLEAFSQEKPESGTLYIDTLAVSSESRNQGVGWKLLEYSQKLVGEINTKGKDLIGTGLSEKLKRLSLHVSCKNENAYRLYKKFGFVEHSRKKSWLIKKKLGIPFFRYIIKELE